MKCWVHFEFELPARGADIQAIFIMKSYNKYREEK